MPRERAAGVKKRGPHSIGSWETTIFRSPSTIRPPAVVEMACIPTAQMKIREQNRRLSFLMALLEMRKLEESDGTGNKV